MRPLPTLAGQFAATSSPSADRYTNSEQGLLGSLVPRSAPRRGRKVAEKGADVSQIPAVGEREPGVAGTACYRHSHLWGRDCAPPSHAGKGRSESLAQGRELVSPGVTLGGSGSSFTLLHRTRAQDSPRGLESTQGLWPVQQGGGTVDRALPSPRGTPPLAALFPASSSHTCLPPLAGRAEALSSQEPKAERF